MTQRLIYLVPGMTCGHCRAAVMEEVAAVEGVSEVLVDLESKRVDVIGEGLDDAAIRVAIDEAGYEVA